MQVVWILKLPRVKLIDSYLNLPVADIYYCMCRPPRWQSKCVLTCNQLRRMPERRKFYSSILLKFSEVIQYAVNMQQTS